VELPSDPATPRRLSVVSLFHINPLPVPRMDDVSSHAYPADDSQEHEHPGPGHA